MSGRSALVTGGARGIGQAIAWSLAQVGFDVAVLDRPGTDLSATLDGIAAAGRRGLGLALDVADLAAHDATLDAAEAALGPLDCLVNNAGVQTLRRGDLLHVMPESFDRVMGVNLRGAFFLTQTAARRMATRDLEAWRHVVFITSTNAVIPAPTRGDYCLSKAGLAMAVQLFAHRLAEHRIAVMEVRPGSVRTDMTRDVLAEREARIRDGAIPFRRWGEPQDIGRAVAAIAGGQIPYATGSALVIDGGGSLRPN